MKIIARVLIIVAASVAAAGIGAGIHYVQDSPAREAARIQQVLSSSLNAQKALKTATTNGTINIDLTRPEQTQLPISFNSKTDNTDIKNPKVQFSVSIPLDANKDLAIFNDFLADSSLKIEVIALNRVIYVKIPELNENPFFEIEKFSDKWIKIDPEEFLNDLDIQSDLNFIGIEDPEKMNFYANKIKEDILALTYPNQLFKIITHEKTPQNQLHIQTQLNKEESISLVKQVQGIFTRYESSFGADSLENDSTIAMLEALDQKDYPIVEFWLNGQTNQIEKMKLAINVQPLFKSVMATDPMIQKDFQNSNEETPTGTVTVEIAITAINEPVTITAPADSQSLLPILKDIFANFSLNSSSGDPADSDMTDQEYQDLMRQIEAQGDDEF